MKRISIILNIAAILLNIALIITILRNLNTEKEDT